MSRLLASFHVASWTRLLFFSIVDLLMNTYSVELQSLLFLDKLCRFVLSPSFIKQSNPLTQMRLITPSSYEAKATVTGGTAATAEI
jgi:hypothetical protein